ncbi:MAG: aspartate aminotransferase family protein [Gemmatimonadales bacterium]
MSVTPTLPASLEQGAQSSTIRLADAAASSDGPAPSSPLLGVYARVGPLFVAGEGAELIAEDGTRYLDFVAGIAVNALGYGSPVLREAVTRALETGLVHVSNLYRTEPGEHLAAELVRASFADKVFFCNSGAEANEAAFKFARKWSGKTEIVAFTGSFHGRLFASLAATDRPDYRKPFEPLVPGIHILPLGDWAAADRLISTARTAAVIIEPVQGEGGVRPVSEEWLGYLRELCDERGAALIFDEVQCGLGRTGTLFAYEQSGVVPDLLTLAKPLAGGLPMGAVLLKDGIAQALAPGDHATTFGGGPLVAEVALEVVRTIAAPEFLAAVRAKGDALGAQLAGLAARCVRVREVRGRGLMWGIELSEPAAPLVAILRERGLLVATAGPNVLRLVPPLVMTGGQLERGVAMLEEVLA